MKLLRWFATFIVLLSFLGCAILPTTPSRPDEVSLLVRSAPRICMPTSDAVQVRVRILNRGAGNFRVYINDPAKDPYELSWLSYDVLNESLPGDHVDWQHGPGGHGPVPQPELHVGPADGAVVIAKIYGLKASDYSSTFRIRVKDFADQMYISEPFHVC
jgi:hypothetical protein